jgi:(p)ppGpp synthase/HD superfamily hydrolase
MTIGFHSPLIERAVRLAASAHRDQNRKMSDVPYFSHPSSVALILTQAGFTEHEILAAALLHDVVEDTSVTLDDISAEFPDDVVRMVAGCSERKRDSDGNSIPWKQRKTEHLSHVSEASLGTRAILLADKLHNLSTMTFDQAAGITIWSHFNASREDVLWYLTSIVDAAVDFPDDRLEQIAAECRHRLGELAPGD